MQLLPRAWQNYETSDWDWSVVALPPEDTNEEPQPILVAEGLTKSFGGKVVLDNVDLTLHRGRIHGLVGQNGSGKSTLIKLLSGFHEPSSSPRVTVSGKSLEFPLDSSSLDEVGLVFVHQDLALAQDSTVLENLVVGRYPTEFGWRVPWRRVRRHVSEHVERFGLNIPLDARVSSLSEVEKALIALARATYRTEARVSEELEAGVLVLDEPTTFLPADRVDLLFEALRALTSRGWAVLFVSHRLAEVLRLCDDVTVLRDGKKVLTQATNGLDATSLTEALLGYTPVAVPKTAEVGDESWEGLLSAHVTAAGVKNADIRLGRGEIVGATGLVGMGHDMLPYALSGSAPDATGTLVLDGEEFDLAHMTPGRALALGVVVLPGNRLVQGAIGSSPARENISLLKLGTFFRKGIFRYKEERSDSEKLMQQSGVVPVMPEQRFDRFSGGNQQKVLFARYFGVAPTVFLMDEPMHGVDVGAKQQIVELIRGAADSGMAVLMASIDYEDLAQMCDRVYVFHNGVITVELAGDSLTEEQIIHASLHT